MVNTPLSLQTYLIHSIRQQAYVEDVSYTTLGLFSVGAEGAGVTFDNMTQGFVTRYTMLKYFNGFIITSEQVEDNHYTEVATKKGNASRYGCSSDTRNCSCERL
jgi:hypothetical protein